MRRVIHSLDNLARDGHRFEACEKIFMVFYFWKAQKVSENFFYFKIAFNTFTIMFPWTTIFKLFGKIVSFIILSQIFLHNFVNSQRTYRKSGFNLCSYLIFFWITVKAKKFRILQKIACKWNFIRYKGFLRFMVQITLLILQYPSPSGLCFTKYKF